jgi:hypothetical protein
VLDSAVFESWQGKQIFLFSNMSRSDLGPRGPLNPLFSEYRDSFPQVKLPGREVHHTRPSSADFENKWSYTSIPLYAFMAWKWKTLPVWHNVHA